MSSKSMNVHMLIIDPQNDFMDENDAALRVTGATDDMKRLAGLVDRISPKVADIHVTLDSHRILDIAHPAMWRDENGDQPAGFTPISASDIRDRTWTPRNENAKPKALGGKTIRQYMIAYAQTLEAAGNYGLMIWPPHCIIGTSGHNVQSDLMNALQGWEVKNFASVENVTKGTNVWTEHYGGLMAEVPMPSDPSTGLNTGLLDVLQTADIIAVAGEAFSHCVKSTVDQIADNIGEKHIGKFVLLSDCMSPVGKVGDGPDFPAIADAWMKDMVSRGMKVSTAADFLA